jgi:hypothetical protein
MVTGAPAQADDGRAKAASGTATTSMGAEAVAVHPPVAVTTSWTSTVPTGSAGKVNSPPEAVSFPLPVQLQL